MYGNKRKINAIESCVHQSSQSNAGCVTTTAHETGRLKFKPQACLTPGDISAVIQMAWEDRTTFETIHERLGLSESDVVRLMRKELKPGSFKLWRKRMKGRVTKHRALRSPDMKFDDSDIADHRRANC
jgi:uncharacterized protein (TIGR03643 family)